MFVPSMEPKVVFPDVPVLHSLTYPYGIWFFIGNLISIHKAEIDSCDDVLCAERLLVIASYSHRFA